MTTRICIHCGVNVVRSGDGWAHENGLVSCRPKATHATPDLGCGGLQGHCQLTYGHQGQRLYDGTVDVEYHAHTNERDRAIWNSLKGTK